MKVSSPLPFLLVTAFLFAAGMSLVFPVLPFLVGQYVQGEAAQAVAVGWMAAFFAILGFFSGPVLGAVSDAYGRRPVLLLSLLGTALGNLIFGIGGSLGMLVLGRVLEGVTSGGLGALMAYMADITEEEERGEVFGKVGATIGAGMIVGPAIGGALAHFGASAPMFAAAGLALLNAAWGYFFLPESLPSSARSVGFRMEDLNPFVHLRSALSHTRVRRLVTISMLFALPFSLMQVMLPLMSEHLLGWTAAQVGTLFMATGVCDIVGQGFVLPHLIDRLGERKVALLGIGLGLLGLAALASLVLMPTAWLLYAGVIIFAVGEGLFTSCINALIANAIPDGEQGRVQGGVQAMGELTQAVGPLGGTSLYARWGSGATYGVGTVLAGLALVLLIRE